MTLKKIEANGDVVDAAEFQNAWLFQIFVWDALSKKYIDQEANGLSDAPKLWEFAGDGGLLEWFEWNVLAFGYDRALVRADDLPLLVSSLREFNNVYGGESPRNHCRDVADWLDRNKDAIKGAGIYGTSVAEDFWTVDVDDDEYRPYNVQRDTGHWFVTLKQPTGSNTNE
jgi:hypothetical protein